MFRFFSRSRLRCRLLVVCCLNRAVGIPAMLAAAVLLAAAYTMYRFDRVHRGAMARYAEAGSGLFFEVSLSL